MWIKLKMNKYLFLFLALLSWNDLFAQQIVQSNLDSKTMDEFKHALSIKNVNKQEKSLEELFITSSKNGTLFTKKVYNYLNEVNLTEKWIQYCGKNVDNFIIEGSFTKALDFVNHLIDQEIPTSVLEKVLIQKIQGIPDEPVYSELLYQVYLADQQFEKAWIQVRSLDKRLNQLGQMISRFGQISLDAEQWELAKKVFDYLMRSYPNSNQIPRWNRFSILATDHKTSTDDYLDSNDRLTEKNTNQEAQSKMLLADEYVNQGKKYDALILLSQVEKLSKDSPIAYEAKLKKAKIYYFTGDFELAKDLLDILKESTQKEIANDALNLRWVIEDNTGIDSLEQNLKAFSTIQFLYEQNKVVEADQALWAFAKQAEKSSLEDDVLFLQAKRILNQKKYEEAKELFYTLWKRFPSDIYADDALYRYLVLSNFADKNLCQQFIQNYPTSLFQTEIRRNLVAP